MERLPIFDKFAALFAKEGVELYLIGGSSRDLLLGKEVRDLDFVSSATPEKTLSILGKGDSTFARFGTISLKEEGFSIDFMTFREEGEYNDKRHPSYIKFVKDMYIDSLRRDFTINAIYIDSSYKAHDFHHGLEDLNQGIIRFIGNPKKRIEEDPLRILRAERFAKRLGFQIEKESLEAINLFRPLLEQINPEKIRMEKEKE